MQDNNRKKTIESSTINNRSDSNDEIDLRELWGRLLEGKYIILSVTILATLIGAIYAKSMPNVYRAQAMLQVESKGGGVAGLSDLEGFFVEGGEVVTEIEILKSRMILGEAVDRLNLMVESSPNVFPFYSGLFQAHTGELRPPIYKGYAWGGEKLNVTRFEVPPALIDKVFTIVSLGDGYYVLKLGDEEVLTGSVGKLAIQGGVEVFIQELEANKSTKFTLVKVSRLKKINQIASGLKISEKGKGSGIVSVTYESVFPQHAEELLKVITEIYVRKNINRNSAEANKSLQFLEDRLPEIERQLNQAEQNLNDFQVSAESINILSETEALLKQMVTIEEQISKLQLDEIDIQRRFKPTHPTYRAFVSQMDELQKRKAGFQRQIRGLPKTQQELLRLKRDVEVNTQIYTQILNSIQELNIMRAGTIGNVRIIDEAKTNNYQPVKPKKSLIVTIAMVVGFMLAIFTVLIKTALRRGIETPSEIEALGLTVIAAIPFSQEQSKLESKLTFLTKKEPLTHRKLLGVESPTDVSIESIRSIRTAVQLAVFDSDNNRVMISGPSPSIGKTFTSANLAVTFAESGKKTVVIDTDLRKGTLNSYFGFERNGGLSEYLEGELSYKDVVKQSSVDGLDVIVSGSYPKKPSELLSSSRFAQMLDRLSDDYDLVIIDSPPILAVTDAVLVGRHAAINLLVCRYRVNQIKEVELSAIKLIRAGIELDGVVFNGLIRSSNEYGYYSYEYK